jgi:triosephosphate isomerase
VRGVVEQLKDRLEKLGAGRPRVIYGGTVTGDNVEQFAGLEVLDGVGATRAGLDADEFLRIVERVASAADN